MLLSKSTVVIALSEATARKLSELGARHVVVIPQGPFTSPYPVTQTIEEARASFGFSAHDLVVTLLGKIEPYKGADLLLLAAVQLPTSSRIKILLVGSCADKSYRNELLRLANDAGSRVIAMLERVPEGDVARYLQATNIAVFPFREVSNSGSVMLAQSFGLPVVISDLPSLSDIPNETAIRFAPSLESLVKALVQAENLSETQYRNMSDAGLAWSTNSNWADIALTTVETYKAIYG
jgi:glycosyltransferase involved in cell wall biosynthesis